MKFVPAAPASQSKYHASVFTVTEELGYAHTVEVYSDDDGIILAEFMDETGEPLRHRSIRIPRNLLGQVMAAASCCAVVVPDISEG